VALHGSFKTVAGTLYKIANDIRLLSCGPRLAASTSWIIPANEPGSVDSCRGKVIPNPSAEALAMIGVQVMGNDVTVGMAGAGVFLEMNVYRPVRINAVLQSIRIMGDGARNSPDFLVEGTEPTLQQLHHYVENSLMLVTALSPVIGYDKASHAAHHGLSKNLSLRAACLELGLIEAEVFDEVVDPRKMLGPSQ
jgi:fumarate hydratase class II